MGRVIRGIILVLRPILMLVTKRDWKGAENLPDTGFVVVANHVSYVDPFTFAHFLVDHGIAPRYLAKASVVELPILGRIVRATGQIPVYRDSTAAGSAFDAATSAVRTGACVIIYPEGTLTRDPDLWPMSGKTGAARVALATGCPVVPTAQWGPNEILAPYSGRVRLFPRKTISVHAGPPVDLDDLRGQDLSTEVLVEATDRIMDAITGLLADIRDLPVPSERLSLKDVRATQKPYSKRSRQPHPPQEPR